MRRAQTLLGLAGVVTGLAAEWASFGWQDPGRWVPDLVTGWVWIACAVALWSVEPPRGVGVLMAVTGFSWFLGNFSAVGVAWLAWLGAHAVYLHRGPLVQVVVGYPRARTPGRLARLTVALGYAAAVVTPVWRSVLGTVVVMTLTLVVSARSYTRSVGGTRGARRIALWAAASLWLVLVLDSVIRRELVSARAQELTLLAYEAVLCAIALGFLAGLLTDPWRRARVADLVVEIGDTPSARLRDALADALGDPTLELGYWMSAAAGFIDSDGEPLRLPARGSRRSVHLVERDGRPVAALVHDPAVLDDAGLVRAVGAATELAAVNARLRAAVVEQIAELRRSRRRIVDAADEERRDLEARVEDGAERRLMALAELLRRARAAANDEATTARIRRAERQLERALEDVRELARGLHPRELAKHGLYAALQALCARAPLPVRVSVNPERLPPEVEAAVYFICAEALANVAKYASAQSASIDVGLGNGRVRVEVRDDGRGGADPALGSGLRGLADRVAALDGMLDVQSPREGGTRVVAEIPIASRAPAEPPRQLSRSSARV